jgi:hypothetical protein
MIDDVSETRAGSAEPFEQPADRPQQAEQEVDLEPEISADRFSHEVFEDRRFPLQRPLKARFHPSRYQFDLKGVIWLFTVFSFVFLPLTLVPPQERFAVGVLLAISLCLAIYAFGLITWIPDSALVIFLVSAPVALVALGVLAAVFLRR